MYALARGRQRRRRRCAPHAQVEFSRPAGGYRRFHCTLPLALALASWRLLRWALALALSDRKMRFFWDLGRISTQTVWNRVNRWVSCVQNGALQKRSFGSFLHGPPRRGGAPPRAPVPRRRCRSPGWTRAACPRQLPAPAAAPRARGSAWGGVSPAHPTAPSCRRMLRVPSTSR